jgi:HNH endonuclease
MDRIAAPALAPMNVPRYREPVLVRPRLGQGAFQVGVTDVYQRRCAVTAERTLPILDAAHIRPYGALTNGLLLRTDIHQLFDLGYVTVSSDGRFEVGRRLEEDFENGRHYYEMHGRPIRPPRDNTHTPARDALERHQVNKFLGWAERQSLNPPPFLSSSGIKNGATEFPFAALDRRFYRICGGTVRKDDKSTTLMLVDESP